MDNAADFTEEQYRACLALAKKRYQFVFPMDMVNSEPVCLWRHDIDFSVERAFWMAREEAAHGISASYFVLMHTPFYNVLEPEVTRSLHKIADLGHMIGLHFDPNGFCDDTTPENLEKRIKRDAELLSEITGIPIGVMTFHMPDSHGHIDVQADEVGGLLNACGRAITDRFEYCSDSNGYWRYKRLQDVLADETIDRLHVLTHPSLWTDYPMAPRRRLGACIEGQADRLHALYDGLLASDGRKNLRDEPETFQLLYQRDPELCRLLDRLLAQGLGHLGLIEICSRIAGKQVLTADLEASLSDILAGRLRGSQQDIVDVLARAVKGLLRAGDAGTEPGTSRENQDGKNAS